jgi:[acyl-carrier-protein] S-malonyltransferase
VTGIAARVGRQTVSVFEVDQREAALRAASAAASLPLAGTREGRQLRRWLTQLIVTERVVRAECARLGVVATGAPGLPQVLPDAAARLEIGSVTAAVLAVPQARALFVYVTCDVEVGDDDIADFHARNPMRFASALRGPDGWLNPGPPPALQRVRPLIADHLLASARRRAFRNWLDARCADLVELAPGYEHPGDPRQPDNIHRH